MQSNIIWCWGGNVIICWSKKHKVCVSTAYSTHFTDYLDLCDSTKVTTPNQSCEYVAMLERPVLYTIKAHNPSQSPWRCVNGLWRNQWWETSEDSCTLCVKLSIDSIPLYMEMKMGWIEDWDWQTHGRLTWVCVWQDVIHLILKPHNRCCLYLFISDPKSVCVRYNTAELTVKS